MLVGSRDAVRILIPARPSSLSKVEPSADERTRLNVPSVEDPLYELITALSFPMSPVAG